MNKIKKICMILIVVLICIVLFIFSLEPFIESMHISNRVGQKVGYSEVSIKDYVTLSNGTIGQYYRLLQSGDMEKAYSLFTPEYRQFVTLEEYVTKQQDLVSGEIVYAVKDIVQATENMFKAYVDENGTGKEYLIILGKSKISDKVNVNDTFALAPENFLEYEATENSIRKDKITYRVKGYRVELQKCILELVVTNDRDEEIQLESAKMIGTESGTFLSNEKYVILPNEEKELIIEFDTEIDFPEAFEITRRDGNKLRTYTFEV